MPSVLSLVDATLLLENRMNRTNFHESFARADLVARGSDRSFGLVMTGALLLLGSLNGWHGGRIWPWLFVGAAAFLAASVACPTVLKPLNQLWFRFGLLLHKVVSPIVMALVFYGAVMPTGIIMRLLGKDLLRMRLDRNSSTYWIKREAASTPRGTMREQF